MEAESQRPKAREGVISGLNAAIEAMNLAKELSSITPAKAVFGSVSITLTMIRVSLLLVCVDQPQAECTQDSIVNRVDYVELGLACADVCTALDRGLKGKRLSDLNSSVCEAIKQLTTWVTPAIHTLSTSLTVASA